MSKKSRSPKARETRDSGQSQEEAAQWEQENFPFALQSMPCPSLAALCCRKQPLLTPAASVHASGVQIPFLLSLPLSYAVCFIVDSLPYQPDLFSAQVRQHLSGKHFSPTDESIPLCPGLPALSCRSILGGSSSSVSVSIPALWVLSVERSVFES